MSRNRRFSYSQVTQHTKAGRGTSRLVSLPLLIIIIVGLTNAQPETSPLSTSSKSVQQHQPNLAHNNSPLAFKNEPSEADQATALFERDTAEQHLASNFNDANNHVLLPGRSNADYQQQQDSTKVYGLSNQFLQLNNDNPSSRNQTYLRMAAAEGEKVVSGIAEPDIGSLSQQLKKNASPIEGGLLLQQVADGGPYEALQAENSKHSQPGQQVLERRFGLFKKGQRQNNNLPFSNFGPVPYLYDCEQCLSQSGGMASQNPAWLLEPTQPIRQPMIYPLIYPNSHSSAHQFNPFKSKFSKLQLTKPMAESDSHYGASFQVNPRYRLPLNSRSLYQSHRFNCLQPSLFGNGAFSGVGQSISSQGSMEDSRLPQQLSY